jgi:hypothetical protein
MGQDYVSEMGPPTGLLFIPQKTYEYGGPQWNHNDMGKSKILEKNCPSVTSSTKNPTWTDLGANPGHRGERPATNSLTHDTAIIT